MKTQPVLAVVWMLLVLGTSRAVEPKSLTSDDPRLSDFVIRTKPDPKRFSPKLIPLWLEALARPEAELKRQAAEALAKAHEVGMLGVADAMPKLQEALEGPNTDLKARLAIARTLVALDVRSSAPALKKQAEADGFEMCKLVEPALARWNYEPMREIWVERLKRPETPRGPLLLAIEAVEQVKLEDAAKLLLDIVIKGKMADVRLAAARSAGSFKTSGFEAEAAELAASSEELAPLLAASLLARHRGQAAQDVLKKIAESKNAVAAAQAGQTLLSIDPKNLDSFVDRFKKSSDSGLRRLAARAFAARATAEAVAQLVPMLDDPDQTVREAAQEGIIRLAGNADLREAATNAIIEVLKSAGSCGKTQAAIVAGACGMEQASDALVALLADNTRAGAAAAWALAKLALPQTADAVLAAAKAETKRSETPYKLRMVAGKYVDDGGYVLMHHKIRYLLEALGTTGHAKSLDFLKEFFSPPSPPDRPVPGTKFVDARAQPEIRASAVWSLGKIFADGSNAKVNSMLVERLTATGQKGEHVLVREMAAVGLGRIKFEECRKELEEAADKGELQVRVASAWALARIKGEAMTPIEIPIIPRHIRWFLEPVEPKPDE